MLEMHETTAQRETLFKFSESEISNEFMVFTAQNEARIESDEDLVVWEDVC